MRALAESPKSAAVDLKIGGCPPAADGPPCERSAGSTSKERIKMTEP